MLRSRPTRKGWNSAAAGMLPMRGLFDFGCADKTAVYNFVTVRGTGVFVVGNRIKCGVWGFRGDDVEERMAKVKNCRQIKCNM